MHISIITDCHCDNAAGRQITRTTSLTGCTTNLIKVKNDIEAAGNIIDQLDSSDNHPSVIVANIAPRSSNSWWLKNTDSIFKKHHNGTPFCYFWVNNKLVISTLDGLTLSLVKKLNLTDSIEVIDLEKTLEIIHQHKLITSDQKNYIASSQFRSFDFVPRVVQLLLKKINPISNKLSINQIPDAPNSIWWVDNFGNSKTTLFKHELDISENNIVSTKFGQFPFYSHLNDVPASTTALIEGSSGVNNKRFIELITQGENTSKLFNIKTGDSLA